jgi:hypothetical protein
MRSAKDLQKLGVLEHLPISRPEKPDAIMF